MPTFETGMSAAAAIAALNNLDATAASTAVMNAYTKNQYVVPVALADAATILTDASLSNNFHIALPAGASARVLGNPTSLVSGMVLNFSITQGAAASTLTYGNLFKFPNGSVPAVTATAGAKDMLCCYYDGTVLRCSMSQGYA